MSKLQVPIDAAVRKKLEKRATALGFDSVQAFIRFWAKAEVDGRRLDFGEDDWGQPSDAAAARLNKATEDARQGKNVSGPFRTVEEVMGHLDSL